MLTAEADFLMNNPPNSPSASRSPSPTPPASPPSSRAVPPPLFDAIPSYPRSSDVGPAASLFSASTGYDSPQLPAIPAPMTAGKSHIIRIIPPRGVESGLASMDDANEHSPMISPLSQRESARSELDVFEYGLLADRVSGAAASKSEEEEEEEEEGEEEEEEEKGERDMLADSMSGRPRRRSRLVREASTKRGPKQEKRRRSSRRLREASVPPADSPPPPVADGADDSAGSSRRTSPRKSIEEREQAPPAAAAVPPSGLNTIRIRLRASASMSDVDHLANDAPLTPQTQPTASQAEEGPERGPFGKKARKRATKEPPPEERVDADAAAPRQSEAGKMPKTKRKRIADADPGEAKPTTRKYRRRSGRGGAPIEAPEQSVAAQVPPPSADRSVKPRKVKLKTGSPSKFPTVEPKKPRKYTRKAKIPVQPEEGTVAAAEKEEGGEEGEQVLIVPPTKLEPKDDIINNEYCSACSGGGSLICCESCPRSFHFTCVDPPMDPDEVPEEHWFCNECRAGTIVLPKQRVTTMKGLFDLLLAKVEAMNPKAFSLPKRIRKIAAQNGEEHRAEKSIKSRTKGREDKLALARGEERVVADAGGLWSEEGIEHSPTRNGGRPSIVRERLSDQGYCHKCNQSARPPHQLLISCDACSLRWHLDCLPYPIAVYPSAHRQWTCPLHLNEQNLCDTLAPDVAARALASSSKMNIRVHNWPTSPPPPLRDSSPIVPESSVRLQFGWTAGSVSFPDRPRGCMVPAVVQEAYRSMRSLPHRDLRLLQYYEDYSYADRSVETETF